MTLDQALHVLAEIHTRDDDLTGFVLMVGAEADGSNTKWTKSDHLEAWRRVREVLHMQIKPAQQKAAAQ